MSPLVKNIAAAVLMLCTAGGASAVTLDATDWINADDPIKENQSGTSATGDGFVNIYGNGDLAVVTNEIVSSPFDFSGTIYAPEDDDILGLVFGYENGFNNYRITWTGGEDHDWEAGRRFGGLMLVSEDEGVTDVLWRDESLLWSARVEYDFSLSVATDRISFELREAGASLTGFSVGGDFSGVAGRVGVFTRSNGASFFNLDDAPLPPLPSAAATPLAVTPLPGGLPLLLGGAGLLLWVRHRRPS
ncbi:hypothetical protein [Tropicimonas sp. S265A]|uniref:hypothetical protein n=1 Tax=Tropicimonas sp. S265A TaxID=3415134 RepID=UPI003C7A0EA8